MFLYAYGLSVLNTSIMLKKPRHYWLILPIVASIGTQCSESPRGLLPTEIATIVLRLYSQSAAESTSTSGLFLECLQRMGVENSVVPSWRNGEVVALNEANPNVYTYTFRDVPTNFVNTMTVRDRNQCRRDPNGDGSVVTGVTVNGTPIESVVPGTRMLTFRLDSDGKVLSPPQ